MNDFKFKCIFIFILLIIFLNIVKSYDLYPVININHKFPQHWSETIKIKISN